jgi:hypothetical protein
MVTKKTAGNIGRKQKNRLRKLALYHNPQWEKKQRSSQKKIERPILE